MKAAVERGRISLGLVVFPRKALAALIVKISPSCWFPQLPSKAGIRSCTSGVSSALCCSSAGFVPTCPAAAHPLPLPRAGVEEL